jgi:hypothetical protein
MLAKPLLLREPVILIVVAMLLPSKGRLYSTEPIHRRHRPREAATTGQKHP